MEKILLFGLEQTAAIKSALAPMHVPVVPVSTALYKESLESIYRGTEEPGESYDGEPPEGSLLVFCKMQEKQVDKALALLKKKKVSITYKAVMTPTNARWNVLRLYFEMEREHQAWRG